MGDVMRYRVERMGACWAVRDTESEHEYPWDGVAYFQNEQHARRYCDGLNGENEF